MCLLNFALKKVAVTLGLRLASVMTKNSRLGCRLVQRTSALAISSTKVTCSPSAGGSQPSSSTDMPWL